MRACMCVPGTDVPSASLRSLGFFLRKADYNTEDVAALFFLFDVIPLPFKSPGAKRRESRIPTSVLSFFLGREEGPQRSRPVWECQISNSALATQRAVRCWGPASDSWWVLCVVPAAWALLEPTLTPPLCWAPTGTA